MVELFPVEVELVKLFLVEIELDELFLVGVELSKLFLVETELIELFLARLSRAKARLRCHAMWPSSLGCFLTSVVLGFLGLVELIELVAELFEEVVDLLLTLLGLLCRVVRCGKRMCLSVIPSRLCETMKRGRMFCLDSGLLLSIMFSVRCVDVFIRMSLRSRETCTLARRGAGDRQLCYVIGDDDVDGDVTIINEEGRVGNPSVSQSPTLDINEKRVVSIPYVVWLRSHWYCVSPVNPLLDRTNTQTSIMITIPKVFLAKVFRAWKALLVVVVSWECFRYRRNVPMWKGLTLKGEIVGNPSGSQCPTLDKNEKRVVSIPYMVGLMSYWCLYIPNPIVVSESLVSVGDRLRRVKWSLYRKSSWQRVFKATRGCGWFGMLPLEGECTYVKGTHP
ncbi:hypothetical protein V8G54_012379 [Vigna mungo]|uniref:Uncharacterized protein n=1 Tax=Vigna mungo TaxID=3915 RepID=A0AAQ3NUK9_VIGMU